MGADISTAITAARPFATQHRTFGPLLALLALNLLSFSQFVGGRRLQLVFFAVLAMFCLWWVYRDRQTISLSALVIAVTVLAGFSAHAILYSPYENPALVLVLCFFVYLLYWQIFVSEGAPFADLRVPLLAASGFMLVFLALEIWGRYRLANDILLYGESAIEYSGEIYRLSGNTSNPNRWAASIGVLTIALLMLAVVRNQVAPWIAFLVFYAYALLSLSKTFVAASTLAGVVIVVVWGRRLVPLMGAILVLAGALVAGMQFAPDEYSERVRAGMDVLLNARGSETVTERFLTYQAAFERLEAKPLIGVGVDALDRSPHNNFLAYYTYFGVIGVVVYACIFVLPLALAARVTQDSKQRGMYIVLFAYVTLATSMSSLATDIAAQTNFVLCTGIAVHVIRACNGNRAVVGTLHTS